MQFGFLTIWFCVLTYSSYLLAFRLPFFPSYEKDNRTSKTNVSKSIPSIRGYGYDNVDNYENQRDEIGEIVDSSESSESSSSESKSKNSCEKPVKCKPCDCAKETTQIPLPCTTVAPPPPECECPTLSVECTTTECTGQSTECPTPEPLQCTTTEVTATPEPCVCSTTEPTECTTPEPMECTTPEPIECTTPEPVECTTPEPVQCTTPEPIECTTPEPVVCTTPEPDICTTQAPQPECPPGWYYLPGFPGKCYFYFIDVNQGYPTGVTECNNLLAGAHPPIFTNVDENNALAQDIRLHFSHYSGQCTQIWLDIKATKSGGSWSFTWVHEDNAVVGFINWQGSAPDSNTGSNLNGVKMNINNGEWTLDTNTNGACIVCQIIVE